MHFYKADFSCIVEDQTVPEEPLEIVAIVHEIAASLLQMQFYLGFCLEFDVPSPNKHLVKPFLDDFNVHHSV